MIKKISALVCVCVLAFALIGCQPSTPNELDRGVYESCIPAYELCKDYQAGNISKDEFGDELFVRMDEVYASLSKLDETKVSNNNTKVYGYIGQIWGDIMEDKDDETIDEHIHQFGQMIGKE